MLGLTMKLDISARLTPQVTKIICHHIKKNIIKKERKKGSTNKYGELDQKSYIKNLTNIILR